MLFLNQTSMANSDSQIAQASETVAPRPEIRAPIFAELEPFTVTLYGEVRNRILYTAITLRLGDEQSRKHILEYMPEVRDRILKVLSAQKLTQVQTPEGRQALSTAIKIELSRPFAVQLPGPSVDDVLFTAFVVQ